MTRVARRSSIGRWRVAAGAAFAVAMAFGGHLPLRAQQNDLSTLFPSQAVVEVPESGKLARLELTAEVLAACRADLSDLRIFDAGGAEVPFLVESRPVEAGALETVESAPAAVEEATRETVERESAPPLRRESYALAAPPPAPAGQAWDLVLAVGAGDFVSRVEVTDATAQRAPLVAGSVFRLRDVGAEKLRLTLPGAALASATLQVTFESESAAFLEPAFRYESRRILDRAADLDAALETRSSTSDRGVTVVVLERPAGFAPARLRLSTSTPFFRRGVEVWDEGAGARNDRLGRAGVFRVDAGASVESLEVPIGDARGDALRVVIDDGDSPALADLSFAAVLSHPALLFAVTGDGGPASATLRFGGGRAFRPRYDVSALEPALPATGADAEIGTILHDIARLPLATLGPVGPNPAYDPQPALAWARRPGAALDPRLWSHLRPIEAKPSPEGLSRLRLGIEDLGVARADLADLRILDGEERQWAYLLERGKAHETVALGVLGPQSRDGASTWKLEPRAAPAVADQIAITTAVPYFDRPFELRARLEDQTWTIASGRLVRAAGDPRPVLVAFSETRFDQLELRVTDGDDAPLALDRIEGRFPVPEVFFAAPEGRYSLLLGQPDATAPRYDLERVRNVVLAVRSAPAQAGALEANRAFSAGARLASGEGWQRALLWGAIVLLVVFLTVLTLRLARSGAP
jgi:hypothetical protein